MKESKREVLEGKEEADLPSLTSWYKDARKKFDSDEEFKNRSRKEVVKLQAEEKEAIDGWKKICDISRKAYQEIYDLLDVKLIERGESYYNPVLKSRLRKYVWCGGLDFHLNLPVKLSFFLL